MPEITETFEYAEPVSFTAGKDDENERADKVLSAVLDEFSRSFVQNLFSAGLVTCNGKTISKSYRLSADDVVEFTVPEPEELEIEKENIPLDIMYEDECMLVVNKPRGMVVHPAPGNSSGTLVNALMFHCGDSLSGINGVLRPGIVHRIDKDTSGLLLVAKTDRAHISLSEQIKEHSLDREYRAIIYGKLKQKNGTVDAPIGRDPHNRKKMCVTSLNSKNAVTHFEVLDEFNGFSYIKCRLETGRTHQIRVHMAYLGHPVAGDPVYGPGGKPALPGGQCLHAATLGFTHPVSGERIKIEAPLPDYFSDFLKKVSIR